MQVAALTGRVSPLRVDFARLRRAPSLSLHSVQRSWTPCSSGRILADLRGYSSTIIRKVCDTREAIARGVFGSPTYFVDGEIAVADVYDSGASAWKTVLVGTLGRGGPGVFALDVTDPANVRFLWEKSGSDITALGKNIGRPVIAQVANGDWRVLLGNGPDSSGGVAQLVTIGVFSGTETVASTGVAGSNGLTAVLARDTNGDRFADTAYAGDLLGNLWKFTGLSGTPGVSKMFEARDPDGVAQPITAAPLAGRDPATIGPGPSATTRTRGCPVRTHSRRYPARPSQCARTDRHGH